MAKLPEAKPVKFPETWTRWPMERRYLSIDWIKENIPKTHELDMSLGFVERLRNCTFRYNPTVSRGTTFHMMTALLNMMSNRWEFNVQKVDEWFEISTSHPYYQSITKQKHELVREVKEGLAHVDRAISDVELLAHDARRYREILTYFKEKDEHSLKAMFIDLVDVNLPEGVSLRSIAPRWPTIIADFMILTDEDDTVEKIQKKIKVSKAEAVVLTTKVKLYKKWKDFFGREVKDRYRRILERLYGRIRSIEEYRNWLRPLIRRVQMMREVDDSTLMMHMNFPAGAGMPFSIQHMEWWAWNKLEGLEPTEIHRAPKEIYEAKGTRALERPTVRKHEREKVVPRFRVEPYDDVVKKFIPEIEKLHGIKITKEMILEARRRLYEKGSPGTEWYVIIEIPCLVESWRTPAGIEIEDTDFNLLSSIFVTHNILLLRIIEMIAEEYKLDYYIDELLGKKVVGPDGLIHEIDDLLREEFPELYPKEEKELEPKGFAKFISDVKSSFRSTMRRILRAINYTFGLRLQLFKLGPYDPVRSERLFLTYMRPYIREIFVPKIWAFMLKNLGGV
ncbi:MAG: hypothetical protein QMD36_04505 [Candidatus Aenigmarchaeota archaeon]|nr:hypothetical protein [Candidatus Aenigmarchaeota archaeon]